jgi:hypothetical protein
VDAAGASGSLQTRFEDGLRFLGIALALESDGRSPAAVISAACDALKCFLSILETAAERRLPDPGGSIRLLRGQCEALLTPTQAQGDALHHAVEAARLARDEAARVIPQLLGGSQSDRPPKE